MKNQKMPTLAEKQEFWAEQLPNFEATYWLPSHFEYVIFDMEQGNYVIKDSLNKDFEVDATEIWHRVNTGWAMWKKAINFSRKQAQPVPEGFEQAYSEIFSPIVKRPYPRLENGDYKYIEINQGWKLWQAATAQAMSEQTLESNCMINKLWFMKGTPVANLIQHAEEVYKSEVIAQNSKIKFGTDDNEIWWAHDVPYYGEVQMDWIKEDQEWDIFFNGCWQGPFNTKEECIKHLEECIAEQRAEPQEQSHE